MNLYYRLLAFFARIYIKKHKPYIIGINWSVGKTSCRMIIYQTLEKFLKDKKIYTSSKNFNWELWLSLSIFEIEKFNPDLISFVGSLWKAFYRSMFGSKPCDVLILEYGIDRPKEMEFLVSIAKPDLGVFTAIDSVHSEQFGDPSQIANEEVKMIKNTSEICFLNMDDTYAMQLKDLIKIDTITYQTIGYDSKADIRFENEKFIMLDSKWDVWVEFDLFIKDIEYKVKTNLIGKSNYGYIWVALSIAYILNYKFKWKEIKNKKFDMEYELQPGRLSILQWVEWSFIVDSSYNSSPLSVKSIVNTVFNMKQQLFLDRKIWLVLGDMRELGDLTEREHRLLAWYVSSVADRVYLIGESMINYLSDELEKVGYDTKFIYKYEKSNDAGNDIKKELKSEHKKNKSEVIVVCKGSQNTIFLEETVKKLLKHPSDVKKLTRQSNWWLKKKEEFFWKNYL